MSRVVPTVFLRPQKIMEYCLFFVLQTDQLHFGTWGARLRQINGAFPCDIRDFTADITMNRNVTSPAW